MSEHSEQPISAFDEMQRLQNALREIKVLLFSDKFIQAYLVTAQALEEIPHAFR